VGPTWPSAGTAALPRGRAGTARESGAGAGGRAQRRVQARASRAGAGVVARLTWAVTGAAARRAERCGRARRGQAGPVRAILETGGFFPTEISSFLRALGQPKTSFLIQETISSVFSLFPH
jgi:hypothetical protein